MCQVENIDFRLLGLIVRPPDQDDCGHYRRGLAQIGRGLVHTACAGHEPRREADGHTARVKDRGYQEGSRTRRQ